MEGMQRRREDAPHRVETRGCTASPAGLHRLGRYVFRLHWRERACSAASVDVPSSHVSAGSSVDVPARDGTVYMAWARTIWDGGYGHGLGPDDMGRWKWIWLGPGRYGTVDMDMAWARTIWDGGYGYGLGPLHHPSHTVGPAAPSAGWGSCVGQGHGVTLVRYVRASWTKTRNDVPHTRHTQ